MKKKQNSFFRIFRQFDPTYYDENNSDSIGDQRGLAVKRIFVVMITMIILTISFVYEK